MATSTATVTSGLDFVADTSVSQADMMTAFSSMVIGDLSRAHVASGASMPAIGTSAPVTPSPQTGEIWVDPTDPLDTGTTKTHILKTYNGSVFRAGVVAWHIGGKTAGTDPATLGWTAGRGMGWYDNDNKIFRVYSTVNGYTGWHPVDRGLALLKNNNASTCPAGGVVVSDNQTGSPTAGFGGAFTMTTTKKDRSVIGVALESIPAAGYGVVALNVPGMEVEIRCDDASADDTVAAGDYLGTFNVIGEARGLGPQIADPNIGAATVIEGTPCGAFAVALEAKDGTTHLARSRLLGFVGQGAWVHVPPETVITEADYAVNDTWYEFDMNDYDGASASILVDAGHAPILAVGLDVDIRHGTVDNNTSDVAVHVGSDRVSVRMVYLKGPTAGNLNSKQASIVVPTKSNNADSNASLGNFIQTKKVETVETLDVANLIAHKYLY